MRFFEISGCVSVKWVVVRELSGNFAQLIFLESESLFLIRSLSPLVYGSLILLNQPPQPASVLFFRIECAFIFFFELQELRKQESSLLAEGFKKEFDHGIQLFLDVVLFCKSDATLCSVFIQARILIENFLPDFLLSKTSGFNPF